MKTIGNAVRNMDSCVASAQQIDVTSQRLFYGVAMALFIASTAATVYTCASMTAMADMPMPGGWNMSMMWMRMPDQSWGDAALSFAAMWSIMMVAMMLPALLPMLQRYRNAIYTSICNSTENPRLRLDALTLLVALGYFGAWTTFGLIIFPFGIALAALTMQQPLLARAVPAVVAAIMMIAGAVQFSTWKTRLLNCCKAAPVPAPRIRLIDSGAALRHGLQLGLRCIHCCANWTVVLLMVGAMDLYAMAAVTIAISAERLAPNGQLAARTIGTIAIGVGIWLLAAAIF